MSRLPYHHDWKLAFQTELGLRVHWFGRYAGYPEWSIPTDRMAADMVTFFFVEKNACWSVINGHKYNLRQGDLFYMRGGDEFRFGHDPDKPHVSLSVSLALQQGGVANVLLHRRIPRRTHWPDPGRYVEEFEKVLAAMSDSSPFRDHAIAGALLQWLAYLLNALRPPICPEAMLPRIVVERVLAAEAWASARLDKEIRLHDWARAVGLHPVYFGRIFKRETGLAPMAWINHRRLQMASQYLTGTRHSVGDIAEACGFSSPFYFSRLFRRHFGTAPLAYRRSHS